MRAKRSLLPLLLVVAVLLGGCSFELTDDELLRPPKATGNEAEIQRLIEKTAPNGYTLKYPKNGDIRCAVVTEDLDGDNRNEAVAFYRTQGQDSATHMLIMHDNGKNWKLSCNYRSQYTDIDCIRFADYDYDGVEEIFVGFTAHTGTNNLKIFNYDGEAYEASEVEYSREYSAFTTGDYDRDGAAEILAFTVYSPGSKAQAELIDYGNNQLYTLSRCDLDPNVTGLENVISGLIDEDNMGVVLDGLLTGGRNSQVIFYDSEKARLVNSIYSGGKKSRTALRSCKIDSADIDRDGFIEVPMVLAPPLSGDAYTVAPTVSWCSFGTEDCRFVEDMQCVSNLAYGYYFTLPDSFSGSTVALLYKGGKVMKLYRLVNGALGDLLVTFRVFDTNSTSRSMSKYTVLENYSRYYYTYLIEDSSVDDKTVKDNFRLSDMIDI